LNATATIVPDISVVTQPTGLNECIGGTAQLTVAITGGTGTISNYYKADSNFIFAKTGTLSGVVAFSGFLYTKKGKLLIFSTLVNNHQASSTAVRRAVEKFIQGIRERY